MANVGNRTPPTEPANRLFTVHAPRNPANPEEHARFVANINAELAKISAKFNKLPKLDSSFNPADYVQRADLEQLVGEINQAAAAQAQDPAAANNTVSDTTTDGSGGGSPEDAQAAVQNAEPTAPPPDVALGDQIGTTTAGPNFALQDHTHKGATHARAIALLTRQHETAHRPTRGTYGSGSSVPVVTVDSEGRVTTITTAAVASGTPSLDRIYALMGA